MAGNQGEPVGERKKRFRPEWVESAITISDDQRLLSAGIADNHPDRVEDRSRPCSKVRDRHLFRTTHARFSIRN